MNNNKVLVISPTYNESENMNSFINGVIETGCDLLIVDDNSPDNTSKIVTSSKYFEKKLFLILREKKLGYGTAYIEGFNWGLNKKYDYFVQMDADFSHRMEDLKKLLLIKNDFDILIGSRYVKDGGSAGWGIHRKILSKYANKLAKFSTKSNINDMTTGFRLYKRNSLLEIDYQSSNYNGYSFLVDLLSKSIKAGLRIQEVPILFVERENGKSKMNFPIILEGVKTLIKLYFQTIRK